MLKTKVIFSTKLPKLSLLGKNLFLICDKDLSRHSPAFAKWSTGFSGFYSVEAGEKLKNVENFAEHIKNIVDLTSDLNPKELKLVVVGGGSVGDFGGFVASILKRGVGLIHIPSTWLSAMDSSHGGKTALNVGGVKNQIGTFYSAEKVFIIKELLEAQPDSRAIEALGELIKTSVLDGGKWLGRINPGKIWSLLPLAIAYKYKILKKDPFEKNGTRQILNLGHTLGHALEGALAAPHGLAVGFGLRFAMEWSHLRGFLSKNDLEKVKKNMPAEFFKEIRIGEQELRENLIKDKKRLDDQNLNFIFLKGLGKPSRGVVEIEDVIREARRQGWVQ